MAADPKKLLSTSEAARVLGISRIAVFKKIRQGRLPATMIGGSYVITRADVLKEETLMQKREIARASRRHRGVKNRIGTRVPR